MLTENERAMLMEEERMEHRAHKYCEDSGCRNTVARLEELARWRVLGEACRAWKERAGLLRYIEDFALRDAIDAAMTTADTVCPEPADPASPEPTPAEGRMTREELHRYRDLCDPLNQASPFSRLVSEVETTWANDERWKERCDNLLVRAETAEAALREAQEEANNGQRWADHYSKLVTELEAALKEAQAFELPMESTLSRYEDGHYGFWTWGPNYEDRIRSGPTASEALAAAGVSQKRNDCPVHSGEGDVHDKCTCVVTSRIDGECVSIPPEPEPRPVVFCKDCGHCWESEYLNSKPRCCVKYIAFVRDERESHMLCVNGNPDGHCAEYEAKEAVG